MKRSTIRSAFVASTAAGALFLLLPCLISAQVVTRPQEPAPFQIQAPATEGQSPRQQSPVADSQTQGPSGEPQQSSGLPGERKQPRAKSQEELEAYQKFMKEPKPDEQIHLIEDFLLQYPETELKEYAFQAATQAYQAKNDFTKVLTYGELTLGENEDNLVALLVLSSAIPERTGKDDIDKEQKLTEAEQYAKRGLEVLGKLTIPPNLTAEQWAQVKRDAESTPHAALGMVALIREDFPKAQKEFQMAVEMASKPDPVTLYRLGLSYSFENKFETALEALDRATSAGGGKGPGSDGQRELVSEARDFVLKAKAAAETPVSGAVLP